MWGSERREAKGIPRFAQNEGRGRAGTALEAGTFEPWTLEEGGNSRRARATELMAAGVVRKGTADEHSIQELAATADFGQRRVVLQGVWIQGHSAIEYLARREYTVRPTRQFVGFILE